MQTFYKQAFNAQESWFLLTPSGSLFSKIQAKKCRRALYTSTTRHDRWKPAWVILPRLQTESHGVTTPSLVIDWNNDLLSNRPEGSRGSKQNCRWDHWLCSNPVRLVCRRGRITQAGFQRSCVVVGMYIACLPSPRSFFAFLITERLSTTISEPGTG